MKSPKAALAITAALLLMLAVPASVSAKKDNKKKVDIYELSIDDNLASPELGKEAAEIAKFQYNQAIALQKSKQNVEMMRGGEVLVITLPASQLFAPNDTALSAIGKSLIKPFLKYLETPGLYKMLLVMHHDNTGSDRYTLRLTRARVNAVYDWIAEKSSTDYVVPYALGATEPLVDNNSVTNRKYNRRLEIYLVPEQGMVTAAKKKRIEL